MMTVCVVADIVTLNYYSVWVVTGGGGCRYTFDFLKTGLQCMRIFNNHGTLFKDLAVSANRITVYVLFVRRTELQCICVFYRCGRVYN